jgi:hypothetical protein
MLRPCAEEPWRKLCATLTPSKLLFLTSRNYREVYLVSIPTYHERFGLPPLAGNLAEGVVIKPVKNCHFRNGARVIFKVTFVTIELIPTEQDREVL